jgi:hypothetical protein
VYTSLARALLALDGAAARAVLLTSDVGLAPSSLLDDELTGIVPDSEPPAADALGAVDGGVAAVLRALEEAAAAAAGDVHPSVVPEEAVAEAAGTRPPAGAVADSSGTAAAAPPPADAPAAVSVAAALRALPRASLARILTRALSGPAPARA